MSATRHTLRLAARYLAYHRVRSGLLVLCIALVFLLPIAVNQLLDRYEASMTARAIATPLVVGARGSRYDLVLNTLYFRGRVPMPLSMAAVEELLDSGLADPIPMLCGYTAQQYPIVGTSPDYYAFRALTPATGTLPLMLGDVVLGARVAQDLGLGVGDRILSDRGSLYDLAMAYPLNMKIVGVLRESDGPDDRVVFASIKTAWVLAGIGHGHDPAQDQDPSAVLSKEDGDVVLNAAVFEYQEITPDNVDAFHFHAEPADLPLTALIAVPRDAKSQTILKGRYRVSKTTQALVPIEVVGELLSFVFQVKLFFDANVLLVTGATGLFLVLIVLLTLKVRQREMETMFRIGCARMTVAKLLGTELLIVVLLGISVAAIAAMVLTRVLEDRLWVGG